MGEVVQFPARPNSDVAPLLRQIGPRRQGLNHPDWVYVLGLAIDRNATDGDRRRLGRIADKLQEAGL